MDWFLYDRDFCHERVKAIKSAGHYKTTGWLQSTVGFTLVIKTKVKQKLMIPICSIKILTMFDKYKVYTFYIIRQIFAIMVKFLISFRHESFYSELISYFAKKTFLADSRLFPLWF